MEFLKCLGLPIWATLGIAASFFGVAVLLYWILLTIFRLIFRRDGFWAELIQSIRISVLFLILEIAAFAAVALIEPTFEEGLNHVLRVILIATMGWILTAIVRAWHRNFVCRYEKQDAIEQEDRSMVTQLLFLYRLLVFIIVAVTFAAILLTFPSIKTIGIGILSSAGIAGIALGIAARPMLLNLLSGFQIAMTKTIKIGDAVYIEGELAQIESINLTHVIAKTWDFRRLVLPISYFIDKPFQNWDVKDSELIGTSSFFVDHSASLKMLRKKTEEWVKAHPSWNQKSWGLNVTNVTEKGMEVRISATGNTATQASNVVGSVREQLIEYLQTHHRAALPHIHIHQTEERP